MSISLSHEEFSDMVLLILESLPNAVWAYLDNVDVVVEEWPSLAQLHGGSVCSSHDLLGLYEGIPQSERYQYNLVLPDKITLFQKPIESICENRDEVTREIKVTVIHELAHHFGLDDVRLHELGLG